MFHRSTPRSSEFRIEEHVYARIRDTIGRQPVEEGAMLGGVRAGDAWVVTEMFQHEPAKKSSVLWYPHIQACNDVLQRDWIPRGIFMLGFVHSHPRGVPRPSSGDLAYVAKILNANPDLAEFFLPIVMSEADGQPFDLIGYVVRRSGGQLSAEPAPISRVPSGSPVARALGDTSRRAPRSRPEPAIAAKSPTAATFDRIASAYDLGRLERARLVYVGVGGAAQFIEDAARSGVGQHVLIDADRVSETNLATQQTYRRDIGRLKVDCVAERILDINPEAGVLREPKLLDEIDDRAFEKLLFSPMNDRPEPSVVVLFGFTDQFWPQARVNRLGLHFGVPTLSAQLYREGRGAEICFTYPGVTPACQRCATSSRYESYKRGYKNNVTSHGSPLFATGRVNALKGFLTMALLHHGMTPRGDRDPVYDRWGTLISRIGDRSYVQIRMDPDIDRTLGLSIFSKELAGAGRSALFDETIWIAQKPDRPENGFPECPDCGGTGDLRAARGTFDDTRKHRD